MRYKKAAACLMAVIMMCSAAGCSNSADESSSGAVTAKKAASGEKAAENDVDDGSEDADSGNGGTDTDSEDYKPGELLSAAAELFDGDYTMKCSVSYSDEQDVVTDVVQTVSGGEVYISYRQRDSFVDYAYYYDGSSAYQTDNALGIYCKTDELTSFNTVKMIIDNELEQTSTHIPADVRDMSVEEYTYAGDTYMSVIDVYFDADGRLVKYTVTYNAEGSDEELVQTVDGISVAEEPEIKDGVLEGLTDFDGMTEDERLGFCQGVCGKYGISTDDMYEQSITTDDLKRIDFDSFTKLVRLYGSGEAATASGTDADGSAADDESSAAEDDTSSAE